MESELSLQFSRSIRVLRLDTFRAARLGLALGALLMLALIVWFFLARVALYEVSTSIQSSTVKLGSETQMTATFSDEAIGRIRSGQSAWLRLESGADGQPMRLPALIYDVPPEGSKVVFVVLAPDTPGDLNAERLKGRLEVQVESVTPAQLVLRSSGRMLNNNGQSPVSTQSNGND